MYVLRDFPQIKYMAKTYMEKIFFVEISNDLARYRSENILLNRQNNVKYFDNTLIIMLKVLTLQQPI